MGRPKKKRTAPKRAISAYAAFVRERRPGAMKEFSDLSFQQVAKRIGQEWKELDSATRARFQSISDADKLRYNEEKVRYQQEAVLYAANPNAKEGTGRRKDKDAPKNPMSSYNFYVREMRSVIGRENPNLDFKELSALVGSRWRTLSQEEKAVYEDMATNDRDRYNTAVIKYRSRLAAESATLATSEQNSGSLRPTPSASSGMEVQSLGNQATNALGHVNQYSIHPQSSMGMGSSLHGRTSTGTMQSEPHAGNLGINVPPGLHPRDMEQFQYGMKLGMRMGIGTSGGAKDTRPGQHIEFIQQRANATDRANPEEFSLKNRTGNTTTSMNELATQSSNSMQMLQQSFHQQGQQSFQNHQRQQHSYHHNHQRQQQQQQTSIQQQQQQGVWGNATDHAPNRVSNLGTSSFGQTMPIPVTIASTGFGHMYDTNSSQFGSSASQQLSQHQLGLSQLRSTTAATSTSRGSDGRMSMEHHLQQGANQDQSGQQSSQHAANSTFQTQQKALAHQQMPGHFDARQLHNTEQYSRVPQTLTTSTTDSIMSGLDPSDPYGWASNSARLQSQQQNWQEDTSWESGQSQQGAQKKENPAEPKREN